ncbi:MAG: PhoPQ-activated pathogenicity-related family protein [Planctomycetes bacterium]|nr:PhoPQ-activated pathogenicity-related family protein [Planctomycetota bacterium]
MRLIAALGYTLMVVMFFTAEAKEPNTDSTPTALQDYVAAKDDAYAWKILKNDRSDGFLTYDIELTSQVWQGITWKHALTVFVPPDVRHKDTLLLFIMGGSIGKRPGDDDRAMGRKLAAAAQMPVALLHQVPNQPLLGDRKEDDLISETFLRYLDTKDATWPLLFPMVKSAVRAMDALQEIALERHNTEIERFVVTGGSKRGWTTWLSAVADDRVAGIAPIVIDTLNFRPQMKHQKETWGEYSEQIADYTLKGLVDVMEKQPEIPLWRWVDPYTYRSQLSLPKLLINGTNDRYWVIDAMNLYWDDLIGEKHVLYVPNAGHGLDGGREHALTTLAVFAQHIAIEEPLPDVSWKHDDDGGQMRLVVESTPKPKAVRLWVAHSDDKDFRPDRWNATPLEANGDGAYVGHVEKPTAGYVAFFAEATYPFGDLEYGLSTQIRQE